MARINWFDEETQLPLLDERLEQLEHFVTAMADGVIEKKELEGQQGRLVEAMKAADAALNDEQQALVTKVLVELSAYNVMRMLHEMQAARLERMANR